MSQLVYVETSIPGFYFETRLGAQLQARREWTREWWEVARLRDDLVTSMWVLVELDQTPEPKRSECINLLERIRLLETDPQIDRMVETYIQHKVMPADADGDARHLAVATFWRCDALATWNCRHIANAKKADHIHRINDMLGYPTPQLITPLELLEVEP